MRAIGKYKDSGIWLQGAAFPEYLVGRKSDMDSTINHGTMYNIGMFIYLFKG
jgi:hypothetical protein